MQAALSRLAPVAHAVVLAVVPGLAERLRATDVGRALARTLRIGLLDELGWPVLEQAMPDFPIDKSKPHWLRNLSTVDAWPGLVLASQAKAIALGPDAVLLQHDVRLPSGHPLASYGNLLADYVDGQFLLTWRSASGSVGYWSGRPAEVFDVPDLLTNRFRPQDGGSLPLPSGGRTFGGRPLLPGDKSFSERRRVVSDGAAWWRLEEQGWREYDPATGTPGRRSLPTFFEAGLTRDGAELLSQMCFLAPVPGGFEKSPLGTAKGLVGWRVVKQSDGGKVGASIDGRALTLSSTQTKALQDATPAASMSLPDGSTVGVLANGWNLSFWDGERVGSRYTPGDRFFGYAAGTAYVPPLAWWHALRPRDPKGSLALRKVSDTQGTALVAAGSQAITRVLPGLSDKALTAGVTGAVQIAVDCAKTLASLPEVVSGNSMPPPSESTMEAVPDLAVAAGLAGLASRNGAFAGGYTVYGQVSNASTAMRSMRGATAAVATPTKKSLLGRLSRNREVRPAEAFVPSSVNWPTLVGGLGAVALRASSAATPELERRALVALLEAACDTPLVEPDGRWRLVVLVGKGKASDYKAGTVISTSAGTAIFLNVEQRWNGNPQNVPIVTAIEHAPTGKFGAVPGFTVESSRPSGGWGGQEHVRELLTLIGTRGPAPWKPEAVDQLIAATGITRAEASLLLAGLPRIDSYDSNFLDKHTRETLGLKVTEAGSARPSLAALTASSRLLLCGLAMPDQPADLWDLGPNAKAVATTWVSAFGRRVSIPEELVAEVNTAMKHRNYPAASLLQGLADPSSCSWLTADKKFFVKEGKLMVTGGQGGFDGAALVAGASALLWLIYRLPLDSPLRASLPRAYELLRNRLSNPDLLVATLQGLDVSGFRQAYGHPARPAAATGLGPMETLTLGKVGILVDRGYGQSLYVRPAQLAGPQDPLLKAAESLYDPTAAALRLLADPAMGRLVGTLGSAGAGWAQDPRVSAPALIVDVQKALSVDESAARLYLQLLALPDPTDKNIGRWNDWTPAQIKTSTAALLDAGAVVAGKRSRAGRSCFLPGGWLDVKAPMLPIEVWKVSLLDLVPDGRGQLGVIVPAQPLSELFEKAWARVRSGEGPALEQLQTGRRR